MMAASAVHLHIASPRKLPRPKDLVGRVVVLDIAFASHRQALAELLGCVILSVGYRLAPVVTVAAKVMAAP